jgi:[ribosomal protein S18]-alanine N-acetyltransferase
MAVERIFSDASPDSVRAMNRIAALGRLAVYPDAQARVLLANPAIRLFLLRSPAISSRPVAYLLLQSLPPDGEIFDIAVLPWLRGCGLGGRLLTRGLAHLRRQGCRRCLLEVRESNLTAVQFYQRHGFRPAGRRRGYYSRPAEDALVLERAFPAGDGGDF